MNEQEILYQKIRAKGSFATRKNLYKLVSLFDHDAIVRVEKKYAFTQEVLENLKIIKIFPSSCSSSVTTV